MVLGCSVCLSSLKWNIEFLNSNCLLNLIVATSVIYTQSGASYSEFKLEMYSTVCSRYIGPSSRFVPCGATEATEAIEGAGLSSGK